MLAKTVMPTSLFSTHNSHSRSPTATYQHLIHHGHSAPTKPANTATFVTFASPASGFNPSQFQPYGHHYVRYVLDPAKLTEFEHYGRLWLPLVTRFGGQHHGYFLPSEGANNIALALFTFESLTAYERYRLLSFADPDCQAAFRYAEDTRCILSYERSFFRPVFS